MIRIQEHFNTVVKEELSIAGISINHFENSSLKGITLHIGLKKFKFDSSMVSPRMRLKSFRSGSFAKRSTSKISEPELSVRKGEIVGIKTRISNKIAIAEFIDARV
jgi:ribosomal protein L5